jgi:hypothetical protein
MSQKLVISECYKCENISLIEKNKEFKLKKR